jgi:hypothetical protein
VAELRIDEGTSVTVGRRSSGTLSAGESDVRPGVFICYRREDSPGQALRVYQLLSSKFGEDRVFMDLEIPAAVDFVEWIEEKIGASGVVIPIIGRAWLATDTAGRRRVDDERDFVRNEIVGALESAVGVLPVLVDGAQMPGEHELPSALARLPRIHAHELRSDVYWKSSNEKLIERVVDLLGEEPIPPPPPPPPLPARVIAIGLASASLLAVGLALLWNTYITPDFRFLPVAPGVFTAVAPVGVLAGALLALARASRDGKAGWLGVGLLAGFGFEAAAKGVSLLGESDARVQGGGLLWVVGGVVLGAAAAATASHLSKRAPTAAQREPARSATAFVAVLGAAMLVVGAVIPFNVATPGGNRVVASDSWLGVDPIGTALAVLAAVTLLFTGRRRLAAGLLIALGLGSALLWARYVGIPVTQWLHTEGVASPRVGGLIGLAGSLVVLGAGWRLALRRADVSNAEPMPTP